MITTTVQDELIAIDAAIQAHSVVLADSYVASEVAKSEGDTKALAAAQARIARALEAMQPLRQQREDLAAQAQAENAARQRANKEIRLHRFQVGYRNKYR